MENSGLLVRRLAMANMQLAACLRTRRIIAEVLEAQRKQRDFKERLREVREAIRLSMASAREYLDDDEDE